MPDELLPAAFALPSDVDPPFTDDDLDQAVAARTPLAAEISTIAEVEYTMAKLARIEATIYEATAQRAAWISRIDDWYRGETDGLGDRRGRLEMLLESWALAERRSNPRGAATFRTPSGEISTRAQREPSVVLAPGEDGGASSEVAVLSWAADALTGDAYDDVVNTTTKLRISELRKFVTIVELERAADDDMSDPRYVVVYQSDPDDDTTREIVPGLVVEPPSTTAKVRPLV